jgi:hypothetical protein
MPCVELPMSRPLPSDLGCCADGHNYKYVAWCSGEREFYDRSHDRYELVNSIKSVDPRLIDR